MQLIVVADISVIAHGQIPMVIEILQLQFVDKVVDVPVVVLMLVVVQRQVPCWLLRLFRAVCTGTRPGLTPAIRAGKGWRGRRESVSQVFCHPN